MSEQGMRIGAAANQASNVLTGVWRAVADGTITTEQVVQMHADLTADFVQNMNTLDAVTGLSQELGATPVAQVAPVVAQAPVPVAQAAPAPVAQAAGFPQAGAAQEPFPAGVVGAAPAVAPAPNFQAVPGVVASLSDDEKWQKMFANPSAFYDNRADKATGINAKGYPVKPTAPDFKEKNGDIALWLTGKFGDAPDWVMQRLGG